MSAAKKLQDSWEPYVRCSTCPLFIPSVGNGRDTCMKANRYFCKELPTMDEVKAWQPCGPWEVEPRFKPIGHHDPGAITQIAMLYKLKAECKDEEACYWEEVMSLGKDGAPNAKIAVEIDVYLDRIGYSKGEIKQFHADADLIRAYFDKLENVAILQGRIDNFGKSIQKLEERIKYAQIGIKEYKEDISKVEAEKTKILKELGEA